MAFVNCKQIDNLGNGEVRFLLRDKMSTLNEVLDLTSEQINA